MSNYRSVIVRNIEELPIDHEEWDHLVSQNEINTIFQSYDWFQCWWSNFGEKSKLFLILLYDHNDNLCAIAPFCIRVKSKNKPELVFVGDGNADYVDFIIPDNKETVLRTILDVINQHSAEIMSVLIRNLPQYSSSFGLLSMLAKSEHYCISEVQEIACPTLLVRKRENEIVKLVNKYSVKRPFNYFKKQGTLRHVIIRDLETARRYLTDFFSQHIQRWNGTNSPSLFKDDLNQSFYQCLLETFLPKEQLLFSVVLLDEIPLSYHFGFDYGNIVTWYKPSYSVKHAKHSPGTLLVRYLIEYALNNNRTELDFTIGDESFKNRFTNVLRYNATLLYFPVESDYKQYERKRKLKNMAKFLVPRR